MQPIQSQFLSLGQPGAVNIGAVSSVPMPGSLRINPDLIESYQMQINPQGFTAPPAVAPQQIASFAGQQQIPSMSLNDPRIIRQYIDEDQKAQQAREQIASDLMASDQTGQSVFPRQINRQVPQEREDPKMTFGDVLRPDQRRLAYMQQVNKRTQEYIAGIPQDASPELKSKMLQMSRSMAMQDVEGVYGKIPDPVSLEKPFETTDIPGTDQVILHGGGLTQPQLVKKTESVQNTLSPVIDSTTGQSIPGLAVFNGKVIERPSGAADGVQIDPKLILDQNLAELHDLIGAPQTPGESVETANDRKAKEDDIAWATGLTGKISDWNSGWLPSTSSGIREKINQIVARAAILGRGMFKGTGAISDADQKLINQGIAAVNTAGSDEQAIQSLRKLQQMVMNIAEKTKAAGRGQQGTTSPAGMNVKNYNPATGRLE